MSALLSPRTSSTCEDGFVSSGPSPTVHLLGCGQVGSAFLRLLPHRYRLLCLSDSSASFFCRPRLSCEALLDHKSRGQPLSALQSSKILPLPLLLSLTGADLVVDCTPSDLASAPERRSIAHAALRAGASVAFASKSALVEAPELFFGEEFLPRIGINAVLGGTGLLLQRELALLRAEARSVTCVPNASTTSLLELLELGHSVPHALEIVQQKGILEPDPHSDLSGTDAWIKLRIVAALLFGQRLAPWTQELTLPDRDTLLERRKRGFTTRLVGRVSRDGAWSLRYEAVPCASLLAVDDRRVVYSYELRSHERRVHLGRGIGAHGTAQALLADLDALTERRGR